MGKKKTLKKEIDLIDELDEETAKEELKRIRNYKCSSKVEEKLLAKKKLELELKAGIKKEVPKSSSYDSKKVLEWLFLGIIITLCIAIPFIIIHQIKNWWNNYDDTDRKISELEHDEKACREKGMYPYRSGCDDDINDSYCYVACMPYPQKK